MKSQVEIFVNRMKSNSSRGRSNANDSAVQTLFLNVTSMHSKLLAYIKEMDDKRMWFEQLQDKLTQVKDSRAALDMLRHEHQEKLRRIAEETERQRQMQMAHTLELMRKKKQEYLLYQRQLALRQIQEQEREMQMRQEQQKALYQMGGGNFNYMPGIGQPQGSPIHMMGGANYGYVPPIVSGHIQTSQPGSLPGMHQPSAIGINQMQAGPMSHGPIPSQLGSMQGQLPQGVLPQGQMNQRFQNTQQPHQPSNAFPPNANHPSGQISLAMHTQQQQPQIQGALPMTNDIQSQQGQFSAGNNVPVSQLSAIGSNHMGPAQNMQQPQQSHNQPQQQQPGINPINSHMQPMIQQQQQVQPITQGQQAPLAQPQQQQQQNFAPQQQSIPSSQAAPNNQPVNNAEPSKPAEAELISFD